MTLDILGWGVFCPMLGTQACVANGGHYANLSMDKGCTIFRLLKSTDESGKWIRMTGMTYRIGQWLLQRLGGTAFILALTLGATGQWMYFKDTLALEQQRTALLETLSGERAHVQKAREAVEK